MKNKPTIVLGLNDSNSAAALIKDGKLVAHAREERFNRSFRMIIPPRLLNIVCPKPG